jgi:DNA-damage-inducible protein J
MSTKKDSDTIQVRIDPILKAKVESIFDKLGMSTSQAVKIFLSQVAMEKGLPFPVTVNEPEIPYVTDEEEIEIGKALANYKKGKYITVKGKEELQRYLDSIS